MITEFAILALTVSLEGTGEPYAGKVMIGETIGNRHIMSGKSFVEVCFARKQYSCWNNRKKDEESLRELYMARSLSKSKKAREEWQQCIQVAIDLLKPDYKPVSPATHFHNPKKSNPRWKKGMRKVANVGNHVFYAKEKIK